MSISAKREYCIFLLSWMRKLNLRNQNGNRRKPLLMEKKINADESDPKLVAVTSDPSGGAG